MSSLEEVVSAIQESWCEGTTDNWNPDRPSTGQCAVSSLVLQDYLGGNLVRVMNEDISHYYVQLSDQQDLDITRDQFDTWEPSEPQDRTREYVLGYPSTARRYELLSKLVKEKLYPDPKMSGSTVELHLLSQ